MLDPIPQHIANPPAIYAEAFDEQALKREWDEACDDEQDAVTRKQIVLRKALARWPRVPYLNPMDGKPMGNRTTHSPEMRRFVRDVLGMPDRPNGSINANAFRLLKEGAREHNIARTIAGAKRDRRIKHAVVELVTKYRMGADPAQCMEKLANLYEELARAQG